MENQQINQPTKVVNRIALLDIYRGFALLGIYIVNLRFMTSSVLHPAAFSFMQEGTNNQITWWILEQFFNGKFFPIFSFLFGVGFGMQINKMEEKGNFSTSFFIRRYFYLLMFGVLHVVFFWGGDVLILYALAGFIVLIIRKVPVKYVLLAIPVILLFPFYGQALNMVFGLLNKMGYEGLTTLQDYSYRDIVDLNLTGSFAENLSYRLYEYSVYYRNYEYFPTLISMILLGYSAGKMKFYKKIKETFSRLHYLALAGFIYIVIVRFGYSQLKDLASDSYKWYIILSKLIILSNIAQAFLYMYLISLLYEKKPFIYLLQPLTYAGRMSLTNYIMQTIVGFILFDGMFLGWYGTYSLAWLAVFALIAYFTLVVGSKLWLSKFRYGPLEWIWRDLTYKKSLKFLKAKNKSL